MRKWLVGIVVFVVVVSSLFYAFVLPIPLGYAAKNLCSSVFVADIPAEIVLQQDLDLPVVKWMQTSLDQQSHEIEASFLGIARARAVFRSERLGCTLIHDESAMTTFSELHLRRRVRTDSSWPYGPHEPAVRPSEVQHRLDIVADGYLNQADLRTRALLVIHNDSIIYEGYAPGFDSKSLMLGWSMTKSITATLVGIHAGRSGINLQATVPIADWQHDGRKMITWKQLMQMSSGLDWSEVYLRASDITKMLYTVDDVYGYAIDTPLKNPPGEDWMYSSGSTNILSGLLRASLGDDDSYHAFPHAALFDPLGIDRFVMEVDGAGNFIGSSYAYGTARDWAKLGLLYLHDGKWNGQDVLPDWWVDFATTPAPASGGLYGAQIWLNASGDLTNTPRDMYYFRGFGGQRVFILPSQQLVVVRLGLKEMDFDPMLVEIMKCFD